MARVLKPSHCDDRGRVARNRGWNSDQLVAPRKKKKEPKKRKEMRNEKERRQSGETEDGEENLRWKNRRGWQLLGAPGRTVCRAAEGGAAAAMSASISRRQCSERQSKRKKNERWEKIAASGENNESVRPSRPASSVRRGLWFQYDFRMLLCKDDVIQFGSELNMWNFQMR